MFLTKSFVAVFLFTLSAGAYAAPGSQSLIQAINALSVAKVSVEHNTLRTESALTDVLRHSKDAHAQISRAISQGYQDTGALEPLEVVIEKLTDTVLTTEERLGFGVECVFVAKLRLNAARDPGLSRASAYTADSIHLAYHGFYSQLAGFLDALIAHANNTGESRVANQANRLKGEIDVDNNKLYCSQREMTDALFRLQSLVSRSFR